MSYFLVSKLNVAILFHWGSFRSIFFQHSNAYLSLRNEHADRHQIKKDNEDGIKICGSVIK